MTKVNISEQTQQTLLRHWQAFRAGDVEGIMADYTEDAVLITPDGTLKGREQIRSLFMQVFANMFPPDSTSLSMTKQVVEGEMAYILWSGSSAYYNAPFCTDTFLMREGKIVAQTFAAQLVAK
jgi:ketosteroid isomerase-like protein